MNVDESQFEAEVSQNDTHRRQVALTSMRGKIAANRLMMETADRMADRAMQAEEAGDYISAYRHSEAVYAAVEEVMTSLKLVQVLCVKSSNRNSIPELPKFKQAVESGGNPTS